MTSLRSCPTCGSELASDAPAGLCPNCLLSQGLDAAPPDSRVSPTKLQPPGFTPLSPASLAAEFPQLEIIELLGYGGMGAVYKARQKKLDRLVALKIIRPESASDPEFAERFNREARTLARLTHPHIVGIHDFGEIPARGERTAPLFFFIMEYVDGANLRSLIEAGDLQPSVALAIVPQICDALQYAHDEGVIHRDIKPENILLDQRGRVKIADFGLAKLAGTASDFSLTGTHQVMGTLRYMAPEQMEGSRSVDHRADIFSLGVVFYELLTGQVPAGHFDPPSQRASIDPRLDSVVLRALAREPSKRFQNASDVRREIDALSSSAGVATPAPMPEHRSGLSTLIDREVLGAWRWATGGAVTEAHTPSYPGTWMILLCLAGGLSILLPWISLHVEKGLDLRNSWNSGFVAEDTARVVFGQETISGVIMAVILALLAVILVMTPTTRAISALRGLMFLLLSAGALLAAGIFVYEARSEVRVIVPIVNSPDRRWDASVPAVKAPEQTDGTHDHGPTGGSNGGASESPDPYRGDSASITVARLSHRVTYHFGYYAAVGSSVVLLLLSGMSTRRAVSHAAEPRRSASPEAGNTPRHFAAPAARPAIGPQPVLREPVREPSRPFASEMEAPPVERISSTADVPTVLRQPPSRPAGGLSTILNREVVGAWRWVAHGPSSDSQTPAFPTAVPLLLSAAGCLSVLLPWLTMQFDKGTVLGPGPLTESNVLATATTHTVSALERPAGIVTAVLFGLLTLLLLVTPGRRPISVLRGLMIMLLAGGALLAASLFPFNTQLGPWIDVPVEERQDAVTKLESTSVAGQTPPAARTVRISPEFVSHRVRYHSGFYVALGLSVALMLVGAVGIRNAASGTEEAPRAARAARQAGGTPVANYRFLVDDASDLATRAAFHFSPLGYSLVEQGPDALVFRRGGYWGGLLETDVRKLQTDLTIRTAAASGGMVWVNCDWSLITWGSWIMKRDVAKLEAEGRDFEAFLTARFRPAAEPQNTPAPHASSDLALVQGEVDVPSLALMVVGVLTFVAHWVGFVRFVESQSELTVWMCVPGIPFGFVMFVGGWYLRRVRSPGWVRIGAIAALLPVSPLWIFSAPIGIWVLNVLGRPHVRRTMSERTYASGPDASRTVESAAAPVNRTTADPAELSLAARELALVRAEVDPPGLVLIAFGVLMMMGHGIAFGMCMENKLHDEIAWFWYPGIAVGFLMCVGGWRLRNVRSPAWVKLGAIAALLPVSPGWIITAFIGVWVLKVLDRPDVKRKMAVRTYSGAA